MPRPGTGPASPQRGRRRSWILASTLALSLIAAVAGVYLTLHHFDLSLRQLVVKGAEHFGWPTEALKPLVAPVPRFADRPLDGHIREGHPRILLLPGLRGWDGRGLAPLMQERLALFQTQGIDTSAYDPCRGPGPLGAAVCWVSSGDDQAGRRGLAALPGFQVETPEASTEYGNLWELAWAYDLLCLHPAMDGALRRTVEGNIEAALIGYLTLLDGESASLWHGRSTLAAQAWLAALVLGPGGPARAELVRRAQGHFADTLRSMLIAQAWPEGYNYWINARALVIGLAAAGMVNGVTEANESDLAVRALERIGLWAVYATRPDGRVEALGDEGPRVDLKDETRRVVDLIAQVTRNPVFSTYSSYIEALHKDQSYYRWGLLVLNDPTVPPVPGVPPGRLSGLEQALPRAEVFGPGAMNLVIARQGWGPDDTLLTYRAGHSFTHHGHYDAGHFTLFKGAPLAINSATYAGNVFAPYLYDEDRLIVRDDLRATDPDYAKVWLLHSIERPQVAGARPLAGTAEAGISVSPADSAVIRNGPGAPGSHQDPARGGQPAWWVALGTSTGSRTTQMPAA